MGLSLSMEYKCPRCRMRFFTKWGLDNHLDLWSNGACAWPTPDPPRPPPYRAPGSVPPPPGWGGLRGEY
eukprot:g6887.t1